MKLGDYVVAYLRTIGVTHLFGIPGDLVINLFFKFDRPKDLRIVTFSHEPGVGFAADGYARATGRIAIVCVTYGAGGHNMVNPIAGSFSERVPILVISGGPGEEERRLGTLIHHQAKEIESQFRIYKELTCAARVVDDPHKAAADIHEVVRTVWEEQRPGYLEIHRDMVEREIEVPDEIRRWDGRLHFGQSDRRKVAEAARDTAERFSRARRPAVIVGIEAYRFKCTRDVLSLVERLGAPCMTTVLAKGAVPTDHPLHMGVPIGPLSPPAIRRRVDEADLVLNLGTLLTDMNLGSRPPQIDRHRSIWAVQNRVNISFHTYTDVGIHDFVRALLKLRLRRHRERVRCYDNLSPQRPGDSRRIQVADVLWELNKFLVDQPKYAVVTESGDMLFAGLDVRVTHGGGYLAQGYYASMGFGVPGALGAQLGTGQRPIVLCGDGAFQMTGSEISHAPRYGLDPVVLLINNSGWGIFRPIAKREELLAIPAWPYAELARSWGGVGLRVERVADPHDLSPVTRKYIRASARKGRQTQ
jgi:indolepyruvate decarboxylase